MRVLDLYPQEKKLIIKEGSLDLLVSAFLSLAEETLQENENAEEEVDNDDEPISKTLSTTY